MERVRIDAGKPWKHIAVMLAVALGLMTGFVLGNLILSLTLALVSGGAVLVLSGLKLK